MSAVFHSFLSLKHKQQDATYTIFFIVVSALHVSSGKPARNMKCTDNNKEYCIGCILLVVLKDTLTMHSPMNIKLFHSFLHQSLFHDNQ